MYITGTRQNFLNRLHQLPSSSADITNYIAEGDEYYSYISAQERNKWDIEARRRKFSFTRSAKDLSTQIMWLPEIDAILDENSNLLFDENGNIILEEY